MSQNTPVSKAICDRLFANPQDKGAWHAFWNHYWRVAFPWAYAMTGCKETANDIAVDVFDRMFRRLTDPELPRLQLDEGGSFKSFILRIATNLVRDRARSPHQARMVQHTDAELAAIAEAWRSG